VFIFFYLRWVEKRPVFMAAGTETMLSPADLPTALQSDINLIIATQNLKFT